MIPERLTPKDGELLDCKHRLHGVWVGYTRMVSPENMAMSLESCAYILWLAETLKPRSAADFGSGLTSYVLRSAVENVWSVDDNEEWLGKTRDFLKVYRLSRDNVELWDDYKGRTLEHDLVVYDFGCGAFRDSNFSFAIGQLSPDGVGIMDDANHPDHHFSILNACEEHGRTAYFLHDWTTDKFGRYAALVV